MKQEFTFLNCNGTIRKVYFWLGLGEVLVFCYGDFGKITLVLVKLFIHTQQCSVNIIQIINTL